MDDHAYLFHRGEDCRVYDWLGAHPDDSGVTFRVWAPHAKNVAVTGDFCGWGDGIPMRKVTGSVWEGYVGGLSEYAAYKYRITARDNSVRLKADSYAFHTETRGSTASKVYQPRSYTWGDADWMRTRQAGYDKPVTIYEVHLGSWRRDQDGNSYTYARLADELVPYVKDMGYTHVELLPVMEHPLDASWGYQCTGYFAPTSRFREPRDFLHLIDRFHQAGIGVILDWVPAHFPKDDWGLAMFDGEPCYEDSDPLRRERPEWGTYVFDYGRPEVRSFLASSALYWMDVYHADGFRVDAVASMLYLDFGREKWRPNIYGGRENLEAIALIRFINEAVFREYPSALMVAEESTAWPGVTKPVYLGGLGFNYKWNMGWMNDILAYCREDPLYRRYRHDKLTFSLTYAFSENYVLPLSHDEVVHLKRALIEKLPGDETARMAGLRLLYAYMYAHPGKKLLFMGGEFGQHAEWNENVQLEWHLLDEDVHRRLRDYVAALNGFYRNTPPLWENDTDWKGFSWISCDNYTQNVAVFRRIARNGHEVVVACNFSGAELSGYRIGLAYDGMYPLAFSTDDARWGGYDRAQMCLIAENIPWNGLPYSAALTLPPLSALYYTCTPIMNDKKDEDNEMVLAKRGEPQPCVPESAAHA